MQNEIKTEYPQIEIINKNIPTAAVYFRREESSSGSRERRRAPKTNSLAQNEKELKGKEFKGDGSDPIS